MQLFSSAQHKLACGGLILSTLLFCPVIYAVERDSLSEEARAVLPDYEDVQITLRDGRLVRGKLVARDDEGYIIRVTTGTIIARRSIAHDEIASVQATPVDILFREALDKFELDDETNLPLEEYQKILGLFTEFLQLFPRTEAASRITDIQAAFQEEYELVRRGMRKIDGEWYSPVEAAVMRFHRVTSRMVEMEQRFRGIQSPNWNRNPEARKVYDDLHDEGRAIAREMPRIMNDRIAFLLERQYFDDAFSEMNAFVDFWVAGVIRAESRAADRDRLGRDIFGAMDFAFLARQQKQIMTAYKAMRERERRDAPPMNLVVPAEQAYIPGGYFFMGNPEASPNDADFPYRVVYVDPFLMDRYQVTNAEYREFVEYVRTTGNYSMSHPSAPPLKDHTPAGWDDPALSGDHQPVVGVDWFDAYAYLRWRGKRLPTEAEWELAARGRDGRTCSWGEQAPDLPQINAPAGRQRIAKEMNRQVPPPPSPPQRSRFSCSRQPPPPPQAKEISLPETTWPVHDLLPPDARDPQFSWPRQDPFALNPYGIFHMFGNAAEWVADWYSPTYYTEMVLRNPQGPESGNDRSFRGNSYVCTDATWKKTFTRRYPDSPALRRGVQNRSNKPMIGIRGVQDIP